MSLLPSVSTSASLSAASEQVVSELTATGSVYIEPTIEELPNWRKSLASAIRDPRQLIERLGLDPALVSEAAAIATDFPVLVPESFLARMRPGDASDPLLRQVLPVRAEQLEVTGFEVDAVDDQRFRKAPGLLRKYHGRALLMAAGNCAIHCRYCFRRHYPYQEEPKKLSDWMPAIDLLRGDESISEIILSGGDPLLLSDRRLRELLLALESVPHLRRLRIHSRLPIVLPDRVTDELLDLLNQTRFTSVMVVHSNHAAELTGDCADAMTRLVRSRSMVLNQAVLLRGVNDSIPALAQLSERLIELGVMPYYLHQLDRVQGAAHFEVPVEEGQALIRTLRSILPGYAVPRYVREIPGQAHKTLIEERLNVDC